jgi:hypothetical protein
MQSRFPAILAGPFRLRTDQTNACARRVVVNFPIRREEPINVFLREKVGSTLRSVEDADFPVIIVTGRCLQFREVTRSSGFCQLQDIAGAKNPSAMAAELPKVARLPR